MLAILLFFPLKKYQLLGCNALLLGIPVADITLDVGDFMKLSFETGLKERTQLYPF